MGRNPPEAATAGPVLYRSHCKPALALPDPVISLEQHPIKVGNKTLPLIVLDRDRVGQFLELLVQPGLLGL